jgi:hypothetical protein
VSAPREVPAGLTLDAGDLTTVLAALADAASFRTAEGMSACLDCAREQHRAGGDTFCREHRRDMDLSESYRDLAAQLAGGTS